MPIAPLEAEYCLAPAESGAALEIPDALRAAFASWLPQSGCYSDGSSFIAPVFEAGLPEGDYMDAYMRCGRYGDALEFGSVVKPNFPFSPVIQASLAVWTGRALAAAGRDTVVVERNFEHLSHKW